MVARLGKWLRAEVIEVDVDMHEAKIYSVSGVEEVFYLGEEMLYGLIFSGSGFGCVKDAARERLRMMSKINLYKVDRLIGKSEEEFCKNVLYQARGTLETYNLLDERVALEDYVKKIEEQNRRLETNGCPTIY